MRIALGSTRLVLLTKDKAIKIGRLRPLRLISRIFVLPFSQRRRERFFEKYGSTLWRAVLNDLCAGLYANRGEYEYYQKSQDPRVIPTLRSIFHGWIVVQTRGEAVSETEMRTWRYTREERYALDRELAKAVQFCRHPQSGRIVLVDYGRPETRAFLTTN